MKAKLNATQVVGYLRVSTDEQRLGPRAQANAIQSWCDKEGLQLTCIWFDLGVSGATPVSQRKGLLGALTALETTNSGVLVAAKRDRLARDVGVVRDIERMAKKQGARVRTADGTSDVTGSAGILSKGMHDLLSEWERAVISERTMAALAMKKLKGERLGKVPFGYRTGTDGVHLEPCLREQRILAAARELRANGATFQEIIQALSSDGMVSRNGKPFALSAVYKMVTAA